jgi:hypothetical protein
MAVAKQNFFTKLGFTTDAWQDLAKALLRHADDNELPRRKQRGIKDHNGENPSPQGAGYSPGRK